MDTTNNIRYKSIENSVTTLFVASTGTPLSGIATVPSSATILPNPSLNIKCDGKIDVGNWNTTTNSFSDRPACAVLSANVTLALLRNCCQGAPIVLYNGGCNAYCNAQDQPLAQLQQCISSDFDHLNGDDTPATECNRADAIVSSILPVFLTSAASQATASLASSTAALSTMGPISTTSSAAAAHLVRILDPDSRSFIAACIGGIAIALEAISNAAS